MNEFMVRNVCYISGGLWKHVTASARTRTLYFLLFLFTLWNWCKSNCLFVCGRGNTCLLTHCLYISLQMYLSVLFKLLNNARLHLELDSEHTVVTAPCLQNESHRCLEEHGAMGITKLHDLFGVCYCERSKHLLWNRARSLCPFSVCSPVRVSRCWGWHHWPAETTRGHSYTK